MACNVGYEATFKFGGVTVGKAQDVEMTFDADEIDVTVRDSAGWREFCQGLKSGTITADEYWVPTDTALIAIIDAWFDGSLVAVELHDANGKGFSGNVIVTNLTNPQPLADAITMSATFRFTGKITRDDIPS